MKENPDQLASVLIVLTIVFLVAFAILMVVMNLPQ
jgi:hypothetical protein